MHLDLERDLIPAEIGRLERVGATLGSRQAGWWSCRHLAPSFLPGQALPYQFRRGGQPLDLSGTARDVAPACSEPYPGR